MKTGWGGPSSGLCGLEERQGRSRPHVKTPPHEAARASPSRGNPAPQGSARLALTWRPHLTEQRTPRAHGETPPTGQRAPYRHVEAPPHKAARASPSRGDRTSLSSARLALTGRPRPTWQRAPYPHVEAPPHKAALASPSRGDRTSLSSARLDRRGGLGAAESVFALTGAPPCGSCGR